MDDQQAYQTIKSKLSDRSWRLNNLYYIKDKTGAKVLMRLNWAQKKLYSQTWYFNIILKARQLGFTTFILIYFLDACLFNSNHAAGVIAHTKDDAENLFTNKVKFAYDNLPDWLKKEITSTQDSAKKLTFSNGSSFDVGTSLRSGTYQKLLISEYGKVSAKFPEKAREIKTGALNTVEVGQQVFVESTAEGKAGEFFDLCETARKLNDTGRELTRAEPRFHFFAWFDNPDYRLPDHEVELTPIPAKLKEYLLTLPIDANQMAWYAAKHSIMGDDMRREYPSTPSEAFEGSLEGAYYTKEMAALRAKDRIRPLNKDNSSAVFTFWDLGLNDQMSIWFGQIVRGEPVFIDYHESNNEGWEYYAKILQDKGYVYDTHFFPHDGNKRVRGAQIFTDRQLAESMGIRPIKVVPVTSSVFADIRNYCKPFLPTCLFDVEKCHAGINHLDNYRKKWNKQDSMFMEEPLHDDSSHGADAFRTAAVAFKTGMVNGRSAVKHVVNRSKGLTSVRNVNKSKSVLLS
jgi:hypothetical protein